MSGIRNQLREIRRQVDKLGTKIQTIKSPEERFELLTHLFSSASKRWGDDWQQWDGPARRVAELLDIARQRREEKS